MPPDWDGGLSVRPYSVISAEIYTNGSEDQSCLLTLKESVKLFLHCVRKWRHCWLTSVKLFIQRFQEEISWKLYFVKKKQIKSVQTQKYLLKNHYFHQASIKCCILYLLYLQQRLIKSFSQSYLYSCLLSWFRSCKVEHPMKYIVFSSSETHKRQGKLVFSIKNSVAK